LGYVRVTGRATAKIIMIPPKDHPASLLLVDEDDEPVMILI